MPILGLKEFYTGHYHSFSSYSLVFSERAIASNALHITSCLFYCFSLSLNAILCNKKGASIYSCTSKLPSNVFLIFIAAGEGYIITRV